MKEMAPPVGIEPTFPHERGIIVILFRVLLLENG
jgi:hypothetical protein